MERSKRLAPDIKAIGEMENCSNRANDSMVTIVL
jgi:hypothetical protein